MSFEPLKGVRVLDLTSVVVGPVCTWRLGQYGAEIVKVESPEGDLMRGLGGLSPTGQHSGAYLHFNRGKRNICLDLKKDGAREAIARLIASADVIVANMRPQALERLGLDAASVRAKHPDKIYCLITGYGTDGPYAGLPTYDSVVQGATGHGGSDAGPRRRAGLRADADLRPRGRRDRRRRHPGRGGASARPAAPAAASRCRCSRRWPPSCCRSIWRSRASTRRSARRATCGC